MVQSVKMINRGGPDSELNGWDGEEGDTEWRAKSVRLNGILIDFRLIKVLGEHRELATPNIFIVS
jgi:hypothetical protein